MKKWYRSRLVWVGILSAVTAHLKDPWLQTLIGALIVVLRFDTKDGIQ